VRILLILVFYTAPCIGFAENLGRLFTSPEERRALEGLKLNRELVPTPEPTTIQTAAPIDVNVPPEIRFSGYLQRPDGRYSVWVNGRSALSKQNSPIEQVRFRNIPEATFRTQGLEVTIKPGQVWSLETNTVREGYSIDPDMVVATPDSDL
jgi:hypothetical protein